MKDHIIVLIKAPNLGAIVRTIPNDLKTLQGIVEGHIEVVDVRKNAVVICNEEAKILSKFHNKKNFVLTVDGHVIDEIYGTAIICSTDGEDFDDLNTHDLLDIYETLDNKGYLEVNFS